MNYYTADLHLSHFNIIRYCNRPFTGTAEMNNAIRNNINEVVKPDDWLYILGDIGMGDPDNIARWFDGLNCKNICIAFGNHDKSVKRLVASEPARFYWALPIHEISDHGQLIVLCHYAMRTWNKSHRGSWHLYGHSHGTLPEDPNSLSFDVGVDTNKFYPYSFTDIAARMAKKTFKPIDHHGNSQTVRGSERESRFKLSPRHSD